MNLEHVLESRKYFSDIRVWPAQPSEIRPEQWLRNFKSNQQEHATALLESFLYFNKTLTDKLLVSSVAGLANRLTQPGQEYLEHKRTWAAYRRNVILTYPTGEEPSPTDSGQMYARWARQLLGIAEAQILDPATALVHASRVPADIIFIDDFAGSGEQFVRTWHRDVDVDGQRISFRTLAQSAYSHRIDYCPSICTKYAYDRIAAAAPNVGISAAHILPPEASLLHPRSTYMPGSLVATLPEVLLEVTERTDLKYCSTGPFGFHNLALGIAFEHSVPDATLPIFWYSCSGWTPLRKRR